MPTVHRAGAFRYVIHTDDHAPGHVHAIGASGEAKIDLGHPTGKPRLIWVVGLSNAALRRAMAEVPRERERMLECWVRIHGRIDR